MGDSTVMDPIGSNHSYICFSSRCKEKATHRITLRENGEVRYVVYVCLRHANEFVNGCVDEDGNLVGEITNPPRFMDN